MTRPWLLALICCVVMVVQARAGGDKVHTVAKDGLKITGSIAANDPKIKVTEPIVNFSVELPAKTHLVKLQGGVKYRIDLVAPDFDPVLAVQDSSGKQVAFNDDLAEGNLNSRLEFTPAQDGAFKVITASLKDTGAFTLTIAVGGAGGKPVVIVGKETKLEGQVAQTDPKIKLGGNREFPFKTHEAKLTAGKKYQLDLVKKDGSLDPLLVLQEKSGNILGVDDDGGGFPNARIVFLCVRDDTYKLLAGAFEGEGSYTLTIKEVPLSKEESTVHEVGAGGVKLNSKLGKDTRSITYQVKLEAGKTYVIDMTSPDGKALDPYLRLLDPQGKQVAQDDDGGDDLNARITHTPTASGTYRIIAMSFLGMGNGPFNLEVRIKE